MWGEGGKGKGGNEKRRGKWRGAEVCERVGRGQGGGRPWMGRVR